MGGANSACLGCDSSRKRTSVLDEPWKAKNNFKAPNMPKSRSSDNLLTSRTMDKSTFQSGRNNSLIRTSNNIPDVGGSGNGDVNQGLLLWNQTRQQWLAKKTPEKRAKQHRGPRLRWYATYESLLASNRPFTKPIPLSEMVDFLVDIWDQEGMYD